MSDVRGSIWADREVDAIVADYFNMLADEMAELSRKFDLREGGHAE